VISKSRARSRRCLPALALAPQQEDPLPVIGWAVCGFVALALLGFWLGWLATRGDQDLPGGETGGERARSRPDDRR
jgi:hypothetical protein